MRRKNLDTLENSGCERCSLALVEHYSGYQTHAPLGLVLTAEGHPISSLSLHLLQRKVPWDFSQERQIFQSCWAAHKIARTTCPQRTPLR